MQVNQDKQSEQIANACRSSLAARLALLIQGFAALGVMTVFAAVALGFLARLAVIAWKFGFHLLH